MAYRVARGLLVGHLVLIVFSTVAMLTILAGPPGPWASQEPAATVMRLSFQFAGPTYVVLGALSVVVFLTQAIGMGRALAVGGAATGISLAVELLGTATGLPFGDYSYSALLGHQIMGRVPFPIPLSWFYMLVGALAIVARVSPASGAGRAKWTWALTAALLMVAWDVSMDPAMVATGHWRWGAGTLFRESGLPSLVVGFFTRDAFYGMPLSNWFGWLLTSAIVARVMLAILPPRDISARVAPASLPIVIYLANAIMPVALCLREGFWWAALGGATAMGVPAAMALRQKRTTGVVHSAPDPA